MVSPGFDRRRTDFLRAVERQGLRGQDAVELATVLAEREALGSGFSVRGSVQHFRRAEARRRAFEGEAARIAEGMGRGGRGRSSPEERRALAEAIREVRGSLTDAEAVQVARAFIARATGPGSRKDGPLIERLGERLVESLRRRCDGDTEFLGDPRCVRILLAGMRMWIRDVRPVGNRG